MPETTGDQCELQNQGHPCVCGGLRLACPHRVRARARRLVVTLAEGLAARRVLELAVVIRNLPDVASIRVR